MQDKGHIKKETDMYSDLCFIHDKCLLLYKKRGYTPLQVLESIREYLRDEEKKKCTYVGRLDPMAEGYMHILWSGCMEEKKRISAYDKSYEIEILCGVKTDTYDALGVIENEYLFSDLSDETIKKYIGIHEYNYPKYSSPHIKKILKGESVMDKKQNGYIYNIDILDRKYISVNEVRECVENIYADIHMNGDFRVSEIKKSWEIFFQRQKENKFLIFKLYVFCKSGTYMRSLANELGACTLSIKRKVIHSL